MRTLTLALALTVISSQAHAATYTATGTYDDGTIWSAEVMFPEAAMADMMVTTSEIDSFLVTTQTTFDFTGTTYQPFDPLGTSDGFAFAGTVAGSAVTGPLTNGFFNAVDIPLSQGMVLNILGARELGNVAREDTNTIVWEFVPDVSTDIPEPVTATMTAMALIPLALRRRRRAPRQA